MKPENKPIIKLVTIDIDRTLIDDNMNIPNANKQAIQKARENGCNVVLCSGRGGASVRNYMEELELKDMVPSLGGCMLSTWEGKVVNDYGIDCETALKIYDKTRCYGLYPYVFKGLQWLTDAENEYWIKREYEVTRVAGTILDLRKFIETNMPNKMLVPTMDGNLIQTVMKDLNDSFSDKVTCFLSSPYYIEVLPRGINKGTAVNDLIKYFNISKNEVLAIGDYYNDVDMFNASGNTACPSNAPLDIRNMVDYVSSADNNVGAVSEILKRYGIVQ